MKHAFGFSWIVKHCDNAKYVLKADDDVIVNLPYLQTVLNVSPLRRAIVGKKFLLLLGGMVENGPNSNLPWKFIGPRLSKQGRSYLYSET